MATLLSAVTGGNVVTWHCRCGRGRGGLRNLLLVKRLNVVKGVERFEQKFNLHTCDPFRAGLLNLENLKHFVTESQRFRLGVLTT